MGLSYVVPQRHKAEMKKGVKDSKYTKVIRLRLSEDEYRLLQSETDSVGCTFSQTARRLMFKRNTKGEGLKVNITTETGSDSIAKCAKDIARIADTYEASLSLKNRVGNPVLTDELTRRYLIAVKGRLDKIFSLLGGKDSSVSNDVPGPAGDVPPFWTYLSGTVASEVKEAESGRVMFVMTVFDESQGQKWVYSVNVFTHATTEVYGLKKGVRISMYGILHPEMSLQSVLPKMDIYMFTDKVNIANK